MTAIAAERTQRRPGDPCAHPGCHDRVHDRDLCRRHGWQLQRHGRVTDPPRWWTPPGPWIALAACARPGPDLWFADDMASLVEARQLCDACPVRPDCLAYALAIGARHGIWGGLDPEERAQLKRRSAA